MQLRKKLCYFMMMVLSCCDLLVILAAHPVTALCAMLWLTENINIYPGWLAGHLPRVDTHIHWLFSSRSFCDEY